MKVSQYGKCPIDTRYAPPGLGTAALYLLYELPDEVLLTIFSYLLEQDLCRVAQVCKRFHTISNDCELWLVPWIIRPTVVTFFSSYRKTLYTNVYEYDCPLFHSGPSKFEFVQYDECDLDNPWKESFKQLVSTMTNYLVSLTGVLSSLISIVVFTSGRATRSSARPTPSAIKAGV